MLVPYKVVLDNQAQDFVGLNSLFCVSSTFPLTHRGWISGRFLKKDINISLHLLALSFIQL